ncbi:MAG: MFS transporter [Zoogloea sp.]|nr:MFS transporter [Zoogloea sp.]
MTSAGLPLRAVLAYGALGLPLAFAALPLYVHVPRLYTESLGLPLAAVGGVLLAARAVDALTDPLIGWANDRFGARSGGRGILPGGLAILALSLPLLLAPPAGAGLGWLFALLVLVSLGYSMASIAYAVWGAAVAPTPELRTRMVASREGFGLVGVLLAAALPGLLSGDAGEAAGLAALPWVFIPLLLGAAAWTLGLAPRAPASSTAAPLGSLPAALRDGDFLRLLGVFAVNGIAAAVPSATVLFFVADVLRATELAGLFLAIYFLAAACSLPLWVAAARRLGKLRAWLAGMGLAVLVFAWAGLLGAGDSWAYGLICVLSGFALGADLALPPSLLADLLARPASPAEARAAPGAAFGWWNFVTKANLALAAGLALPLLALLGYSPGGRDPGAIAALAAVYAFVPIVLKLGAMALLWAWRQRLEPSPSPLQAASAALPGARP